MISNGQVFHSDGTTPLAPTKILLHDCDHKALMLSEGGHLSYFDLETMKVVEEYVLHIVMDRRQRVLRISVRNGN